MKRKIIASFLILSLVLVFPQVNAQTDATKQVNQKSVELRIDIDGNVKVTHEINRTNEIGQLELIEGTVSNLKVIDELGQEKPATITEETNSILILPDQGELRVQYDLDDVLELKNNMWTLDFRYLHTTNFFFPDELVSIITNGVPVNLNDKKGLACHGCQMLLEYTVNEPKSIKQINLGEKEFLVEVITFSELENFNFDQNNGEINFNVNEANQIITTIIPLELLSEPFTVLLDIEKISFHDYINNGTHIWLNLQPADSGEVTIKGVITEPPINPQVTESPTEPSAIIVISVIIGVGTIVGFFLLKKTSRR
ncbi:MAG: hypothetical protein ACR2LL_05970 [Nitrosopumilus sp.]